MTPDEKQQRLKQIEGYAKTLVQSIRVMDERRHLLEPLLRDEEVKGALGAKFKNTFGAHAYNHLVPLLGQDLVRDLARLFLDPDPRVGSLVNLHRKVVEPTIHKALCEKFRSIPDKWNEETPAIEGLSEEQSTRNREHWRDSNRDDFEKSFKQGWGEVTKAVNDLKADSVAKKIKTFRNKYHAHLQMSPLGSDPAPFDVGSLGLTYNDLLDFADRYMEAAFELNRIVTGNIVDIESFSAPHREYGSDMWRILAGLGGKSASIAVRNNL